MNKAEDKLVTVREYALSIGATVTEDGMVTMPGYPPVPLASMEEWMKIQAEKDGVPVRYRAAPVEEELGPNPPTRIIDGFQHSSLEETWISMGGKIKKGKALMKGKPPVKWGKIKQWLLDNAPPGMPVVEIDGVTYFVTSPEH